ncbi:hypothetical protein L195_g045648, partial [Trifolium pratense]
RLIADLSRDLLEEFVPLFPRIVDSLASLLESGADREPDIIEQIFTSWSYIMMYLQKYLIHNPSEVLKIDLHKQRFGQGLNTNIHTLSHFLGELAESCLLCPLPD